MIKNKDDLLFYLECDKVALRREKNTPSFLDVVWRYERCLRKVEYYNNCKKSFFAIKILKLKLHYLSLITGFQIGLNTCGPGLSLEHRGTVIINGHARIGENCRIQTGVTLGATNGTNKSPIVGNNVFIGSGAKLIGGIKIADGVCSKH